MKILILAAVFLMPAYAAESPVIFLRPDLPQSQEEFIGPNDTERRIRKVTSPTLHVFLPRKANGSAIVVAPGGGFRHLAIDKEGTDVARWLNTLGVAAFVLQYRVTLADRAAGEKASAEDGLLAMKTVRSRAAEWKLDSKRIGIAGFSAGGYVATAVAMSTDPATRPDFAIPIYPAAPKELAVPANAPPLFLAMAHDDRLHPLDNGVRIYSAWKRAGASAELHVFARGGHGFGIRKSGAPTDSWTDRLEEWMRRLEILK
jgi:acetyl esterase/lipase